MLTFNVTVQWY